METPDDPQSQRDVATRRLLTIDGQTRSVSRVPWDLIHPDLLRPRSSYATATTTGRDQTVHAPIH